MKTPVNKVNSDVLYFSIIFGTSYGYLNSTPHKDQHRTSHKPRVDVTLLIPEVWCWSSCGAVLKSYFEASEKAEKSRQLCKMALSPYLSVFPWQQ